MSATGTVSPFRFAARCSGLRPSAIREILKATASPDVISFAGGLPAPELFPMEGVRRAADQALAHDGPAALQYGTSEGYPPLREWVAEHLAATVGLRTSADHVLMVNGSQQGLDLAARVLLDPGDFVLVENPSYLGALQAFAASEALPIGVPCDDDGIKPDELRRALEHAPSRPKLLYLNPQFQNPTGTSLSAARRTEVVAIAAEFGVPILEDDPYGRLRYGGDPQPALVTLAGDRGWLYLGTTSKVLAPGLRLAWIVAPDRAVFERLVSAKQVADLHTSSFTQRVVWQYVRHSGALDAHVGRLCDVYRGRRDAMLAALANDMPEGCRWTCPEGGLFLWLELPSDLDSAGLFQAALRQKVAFVPGEPFWVGEPRRNTLRLNFSNAGEERIREGVRRLGAVVAGALSPARSPRYSRSLPNASNASRTS